MAKLKTPTPQELYRARKQREEQEKTALLPPGLYNHGNTCFMNSVLQGLIATRFLADLANFRHISPVFQNYSTAPLLSARSPLLTNGHGIGGPEEQAWVNTMPIGDSFLKIMYRGWDIQSGRQRENLSPKPLLGTLGRKYDQYLDFAQQDAHEFLRILLDAMRMEEFDVIKKRQPPPEHVKKRRRTTITPSNLYSTFPDGREPFPSLSTSEEEKLMSLSDMIFGGKLTSILVCQKCKHVSQTFEDFNDISLSLKAEDYRERKRDRLMNFAKRLTSFPTASPVVTLAVGPEIPRPSSVPPSPSVREAGQLGGHDEPPIVDDPRRRSLDVFAVVDPEGQQLNSTTPKEDPVSSESARSNVLVNGTAKQKHIEIADPVKEDKKEKKDDGWSKIGRRISMSVGLTKGSKERTSRSKKRNSLDLSHRSTSLGVPQPLESTEGASIDGIISPKSTPRTSTSDTLQGSTPAILSSRPSTPLKAIHGDLTSNCHTPSSSRHSISRFPAIRGKSPKPPKSSPAETEYLRRILADITPASSTNPFDILKPTFHSGSSRSVSAGSATPAAQNLWLSLSQFSGIEECLRMFTAVEVLDGENMVGCRRCWKIANGVYPSKQPVSEPDEDSDSIEHDSPVAPPPDTWQERKSRQTSPPLSPKMAHIPTSMSTPTVSFYSYSNNSDNRSVSSLPTDTNSAESDPTPDQSASSFAWDEDLPSGDQQAITPGGLPIPAISTTGPDSPISQSHHHSSSPSLLHQALPLTELAPSDSTSSPTPDNDDTPIAHPTPRLAQVVAHLPPSISRDSLVIPKSRHGLHRADVESTDESSGAESEASVTTSVRSTDTSTSVEVSYDAMHKTQSPPHLAIKKPSRPKPVIMRPAYKRYLIGTPPPILVIHLKRFQQISKTHMMSFSHGFKKLDDYVTFPEYLDLTPYLAPKKEDFGLGKKGKAKVHGEHRETDDKCMYRLYAVVVHIGNMLGGHYIAYTALPALSQANGTLPSSASCTSKAAAESTKPAREWAYISDTIVRLTTLEEVLKAKAYICMYERI